MTGTPVKSVGTVMNRTAPVPGSMAVASAETVSFETVWNNQADRNNTAPETTARDQKSVSRKDDAVVRDSLKSRDAGKGALKETSVEEEVKTDDLKDMDPREWEAAMEVLGAASMELIQQIADSFGMTVEEVQELMSGLSMEQTDVLDQEGLGQLLLLAGGAEDATSLLTSEELYQKFQTLMGQRDVLLEECGRELGLDAEELVQMVTEPAEDTVAVQALPIEVTVENDDTVTTGRDDTGADPLPTETAVQDGTVNETRNAETGRETQGQTKQHQESAEDRGQSSNLLLQNLRTAASEPQLQQLSQTSLTWDADTQDIMRQIMDYMKIQIKPDVSNVEMQLHPASLGTLQIQVASKGGVVTAQFVTQNEAVRAALESQMVQLKESFAEQGVKVEAIEVTVQTHQFEQNLEQGRGRQQSEPDKRTRTRRIQLDGPLTMEDMDAMEEEEQLAAQIMTANGNTVDYTA